MAQEPASKAARTDDQTVGFCQLRESPLECGEEDEIKRLFLDQFIDKEASTQIDPASLLVQNAVLINNYYAGVVEKDGKDGGPMFLAVCFKDPISVQLWTTCTPPVLSDRVKHFATLKMLKQHRLDRNTRTCLLEIPPWVYVSCIDQDNAQPSQSTTAYLITAANQEGTALSWLPSNSSKWALENFFNAENLSSDLVSTKFSQESFVTIEAALRPEILDKLQTELDSLPTSLWHLAGPMDVCKYARLGFDYLGQPCLAPTLARFVNFLLISSDLHKLIQSRFLHQDEPLSCSHLRSVWLPEIRLINAGTFQILNEQHLEPYGLDLIFTFNAHPNSTSQAILSKPRHRSGGPDAVDIPDGAVVYISEGDVVAVAPPIHNALSLAYRTKGSNRFVRYSSQLNSQLQCYQILLTFHVQNS